MMLEPEQAGLVWIDTQRAVIVRWEDGEPIVQALESGVPPKRPAVGSVRRGPARPGGGGRVGGTGTEGRHREKLRHFLTGIAERLADLDFVEVAGRGEAHRHFARLLTTLAARDPDDKPKVEIRSLARRPSDAQLAARLRRIVDRPLPRRRGGPYRPPPPPRTASGRLKAPGRDDFRNPRPRHLPEHREIELEIEMLLESEDLRV